MQKYVYISVLLLPLTIGSVSASLGQPEIQGEYAGDFQTCYQANLNGSARSIEDFVCLDRAGDWQEMLSQIVLDKEFKELDKQAEDYIIKLEEAKGEYFGPEAKESFLTAVDAIEGSFAEEGYYWKQYKELCNTGILESIAEATDGVVNTEAKKYLGGDNRSSCLNLARTKISIYRDVAYDTLKLNKIETRKDQRREYVQLERTKYDGLLDEMRVMVGNTERLLNGWPTKTKQTAFKIFKTVKYYFI